MQELCLTLLCIPRAWYVSSEVWSALHKGWMNCHVHFSNHNKSTKCECYFCSFRAEDVHFRDIEQFVLLCSINKWKTQNSNPVLLDFKDCCFVSFCFKMSCCQTLVLVILNAEGWIFKNSLVKDNVQINALMQYVIQLMKTIDVIELTRWRGF